MRFPYLVALCITLAGAATFWFENTKYQCPIPLSYHIGTIDEGFAISKEDALASIAVAEAAWEAQTGRELFQSEEEGSLTINFSFDDRQAEADSERTERTKLDETKAQTETLRVEIEKLDTEYESRSSSYGSAVASYESELETYNQKVQRYNDQGGAPQDIYAELEEEKRALDREAESLKKTAAELNTLADKINELGQRSNELVDAYNKEVETYNEEYGFSKEFTQGDYQDGVITIYKFSNQGELVTVLAHELGHALGIDHVEDKASLMYYLLGDTSSSPTLSQADIGAFTTLCGTKDSWVLKTRGFIRSVFGQ